VQVQVLVLALVQEEEQAEELGRQQRRHWHTR